MMQQQGPTRHLVREIIRQIPQTAQPTFVCVPQQQQQQQFQQPQQQTVQQFMPVFASRQVSSYQRTDDEMFLLPSRKTNRAKLCPTSMTSKINFL